jgi:hypothetical protein
LGQQVPQHDVEELEKIELIQTLEGSKIGGGSAVVHHTQSLVVVRGVQNVKSPFVTLTVLLPQSMVLGSTTRPQVTLCAMSSGFKLSVYINF